MRLRRRRRQQAVDQLRQAIDLRSDQRGELARLLVAGTSRQQLRCALQSGQRIAQLVRQSLERRGQRRRQRRDRILAGELVHRMRLEQPAAALERAQPDIRSEEHTSDLQSLMRISYAVLCLKKKN